jgi:hypothetical protein
VAPCALSYKFVLRTRVAQSPLGLSYSRGKRPGGASALEPELEPEPELPQPLAALL